MFCVTFDWVQEAEEEGDIPDGDRSGPSHPPQQSQDAASLLNSQASPTLAPQVHLVDGRIVINRQSLTVQAQVRVQVSHLMFHCLC
jgi:hypothetical protein